MSNLNQDTNSVSVQDKTNDKTTTLDATTYSITRDQGTVLSQNQPTKVVAADTKFNTIGNRANRHMMDVDWDLEKMLERHNYVGTYEWNTGQSPGTNILSSNYVVPYDFLKTTIGRTPFDVFTYARWKQFVIYIQMQATRFQNGALIAYYHPTMVDGLYVDDGALDVYMNRQNSVLLEHAIIEAQQSDMVEFRIPFVWNKDWLDITQADILGNFRLSVLNTLRAATGTTTVATVNVYMSLEDAQFRVPRPLGQPTAVKRNFKYLKPPHDAKRQVGNKESALLGMVNEVTEKLTPFASVVDAMGGLLLDKKQISAQYYPVTSKKVGYMTHQQNEEYVDRLTLNPSTMQLTDKEHYNSDVSFLRMSYFLKNKWNLIDTFLYQNVSTTGTVLASYDVGPFGWKFDAATSTQLTTIDYLARRFQYWRGSYILGFQAVVAPLHEGRIIVCFRPAVSKTVVGDFAESQTQYMASFQIKGGQNSFAVRLPYLSQTPYNIVTNGDALTTSNYNEYFNGSVQIIAATPLKVTNNLTNEVDINVFLAAGDDFELSIPTFNNTTIVNATEYSPAVMRQRGQKESSDTKYEIAPVSFNDLPSKCQAQTLCGVADSEVSDPRTSHIGEHYTDLQQMMKRYQPGAYLSFTLNNLIATGQLTTAQANAIVAQTAPLIIDLGNTTYPRSLDSVSRKHSLFSDIYQCFRLNRLPMMFKILLNSTVDVRAYITYMKRKPSSSTINIQDLAINFPSIPGANNTCGGPFMPMTYCDESHAAEFYVPFIHHQSTALNYQPYDDVFAVPSIDVQNSFNDTRIIAAIYGITGLGQATQITTMFSIADEATMGAFQGLPNIDLLTDSEGHSYYPDQWL